MTFVDPAYRISWRAWAREGRQAHLVRVSSPKLPFTPKDTSPITVVMSSVGAAPAWTQKGRRIYPACGKPA